MYRDRARAVDRPTRSRADRPNEPACKARGSSRSSGAGPFVVESIDRSAADLIVAVDGQKVTNADDFLGIIEAKEPGNQVSLTIVRKGKEMQVQVVLGGE